MARRPRNIADVYRDRLRQELQPGPKRQLTSAGESGGDAALEGIDLTFLDENGVPSGYFVWGRDDWFTTNKKLF